MTLEDADQMTKAAPQLRPQYSELQAQVGARVAEAVRDGNTAGLERLCQIAGTYRALRDAAVVAGVDADDLEDALARI
jgi:hypothetical protein